MKIKHKNLIITFNIVPNTDYRPFENGIKPFINLTKLAVNIKSDYGEFDFIVRENYRWDGATIPKGTRWIAGVPTDSKFQVASMLHDKMCEKKYLIDNHRKLSTEIYEAILVHYSTPLWRVLIHTFFVDFFQRFCGWEK